MDVSRYIRQGVVIPCPESVEIDPDIPPENIAAGVCIHAGSRIRGSGTFIGPGCIIGAEAPATVDDCQLGHGVGLKGGYYGSATFLDRCEMGSGSHVRAGTLLEEQSGAAHSVGFKQTILFPFVTAGSLINLCDCLMAGGTGRKNHSEIGSSYIHFNFTPRQDKATASLLGDVPRGVMLDRRPIFLGGQGGLVGPSRIAFGTVIPAGTVCRDDILEENTLYAPPETPGGSPPAREFNPSLYFGIRRIVANNLLYIGNLHALRAWYRWVRARCMAADPYARACHAGALARIESGIRERILQLGGLARKLPRSLELAGSVDGFPGECLRQQRSFLRQWPRLEDALRQDPPEDAAADSRDVFLKAWEGIDRSIPYPDAVGRVDGESREAGTRWLQAIVDHTASLWRPTPAAGGGLAGP